MGESWPAEIPASRRPAANRRTLFQRRARLSSPSGPERMRSDSRAAQARAGGKAVEKIRGRARLTSSSQTGREAAAYAPATPNAFDRCPSGDPGSRPAPPRAPRRAAEQAGRMRLVDDEQRPRCGAEPARSRRGARSPSIENTASVTTSLRARCPQEARRGTGVRVRVYLDPRAGQAASVDDRGVVQCVGDDQVLGPANAGRIPQFAAYPLQKSSAASLPSKRASSRSSWCSGGSLHRRGGLLPLPRPMRAPRRRGPARDAGPPRGRGNRSS